MSDTAGSRREGTVDQLLLEADLGGDSQLRPVLMELQALGTVAPQPSAEVLALMAGAPAAEAPTVPAAQAPAAPVDELAARRRAKRRIALTTLSVAVSLGAGGAVAAASDQGIRHSFTQLNQAVTSFITGSAGSAGPAGDQAGRPATPAPTAPTAAVPAGTPTGDPASVPADPAAAHPAATPPSGGPAAAENANGQRTSPGTPGEVPASETLPGAIPGQIADGLGKQPEVPVPSQVPLPGTLPAVPLP
ncbi:putative uncharacterized protein [Pseudarthrobacter siccitolerans]|uniref:Uncharacterized protein n=1 Tax=Pseudarthrobacter siccitolerans TaxID=861266 RepID=A0A024GXP6_9MICC|nr:hypothetical protein [Pseudarthrobacter siccitolerans]CCQ44256.1 putative uncharacterized protein [Pseudarthrobacter siccitolerans]